MTRNEILTKIFEHGNSIVEMIQMGHYSDYYATNLLDRPHIRLLRNTYDPYREEEDFLNEYDIFVRDTTLSSGIWKTVKLGE